MGTCKDIIAVRTRTRLVKIIRFLRRDWQVFAKEKACLLMYSMSCKFGPYFDFFLKSENT